MDQVLNVHTSGDRACRVATVFVQRKLSTTIRWKLLKKKKKERETVFIYLFIYHVCELYSLM